MSAITREESVNFVFKSKSCKNIVNINNDCLETLKENEIILLTKISVRSVSDFYFIENTIIHNSSKYRMSYSAYDFDIETNRKEFVDNALSHIKWKEYFEKV